MNDNNAELSLCPYAEIRWLKEISKDNAGWKQFHANGQ